MNVSKEDWMKLVSALRHGAEALNISTSYMDDVENDDWYYGIAPEKRETVGDAKDELLSVLEELGVHLRFMEEE